MMLAVAGHFPHLLPTPRPNPLYQMPPRRLLELHEEVRPRRARSAESEQHRLTMSRKAHCRPVEQMSMDGAFVARFGSLKEASMITDIRYTGITECVRRTRDAAGGFRWRYAVVEVELTVAEVT